MNATFSFICGSRKGYFVKREYRKGRVGWRKNREELNNVQNYSNLGGMISNVLWKVAIFLIHYIFIYFVRTRKVLTFNPDAN